MKYQILDEDEVNELFDNGEGPVMMTDESGEFVIPCYYDTTTKEWVTLH